MNTQRRLLILIFCFSFHLSFTQNEITNKLEDIIGTWKLDLTPENKSDEVSAIMNIESVTDKIVTGYFYNENSNIQASAINIQTGKMYVSFITADGSGNYNSTFYIYNNKLYGTTHSIGRDFLSVWTAEKLN